MKFFVVINIILLIFSVSCSKSGTSNPTTPEALYEIYMAVQVYGGQKAFKVMKKYGLTSQNNMNRYYQALRKYSTNEQRWKKFLDRVEAAKQKYRNRVINRR